jgi:hypothetical protein
MMSDFVFSILRTYFVDKFRLTDQRVYVTEQRQKMQWHVDNKLDSNEQTEYPGLIFIFYLCDVYDGYFEIVANSERWSTQKYANFSDAYISQHHGHEIVEFKLPQGSMLIYTTQIIHRAHAIQTRGFERASLFFQVERKERGGEAVLLNTSFAPSALTDEQRYFLGFGAEPEYGWFPATGKNSVRPGQLLHIASDAVAAAIRAVLPNLVWGLNPDTQAKVYRWRKHLRKQE